MCHSVLHNLKSFLFSCCSCCRLLKSRTIISNVWSFSFSCCFLALVKSLFFCPRSDVIFGFIISINPTTNNFVFHHDLFFEEFSYFIIILPYLVLLLLLYFCSNNNRRFIAWSFRRLLFYKFSLWYYSDVNLQINLLSLCAIFIGFFYENLLQ